MSSRSLSSAAAAAIPAFSFDGLPNVPIAAFTDASSSAGGAGAARDADSAVSGPLINNCGLLVASSNVPPATISLNVSRVTPPSTPANPVENG